MIEEHLNAPETNDSTAPMPDPKPTIETELENEAENEAETEIEAEPGGTLEVVAEVEHEAVAPEQSTIEQSVLLPDPNDSPFFRGGPTPDLELPAEEFPAEQGYFATESRFRREQQQEQDAAVASLDQTLLRPFVAPIDFGPADEQDIDGGSSVPGGSAESVAAHKVNWRKLSMAAVLTAIALAVSVRAFGSRHSNVGLFGVITPPEKSASWFTWPVKLTPSEPVTPVEEEESFVKEESFVEEEPLAEEEPEEQTYEEESPAEESDEPRNHTFTWDFSEPTNDYSDSNSDSDGESDYYSYTNQYDSWDDTDDSNSNNYNDDSSISLTFDGGNVTYYYNDDVVTMDWDLIDELERYLDSYDAWGYGSPGGEQGYGSGYGGRGRSHDEEQEPVYYYYYGW